MPTTINPATPEDGSFFDQVRLKFSGVRLQPDMKKRGVAIQAVYDNDCFCPCQPMRVTCLTCPSVKKVSLLVSDNAPDYQVAGKSVTLTLPSILDHEVIALDLHV